MNMKTIKMYMRDKILFLTIIGVFLLGVASLVIPWNATVFESFMPKAEAAFTGGRITKYGFVVSRGFYSGPNGYPIYAEIDNEGQVVTEIGEFFGPLRGAVAIAAVDYSAMVTALDSVKQANPDISEGAYVLTREEYLSRDFGSIEVPLMNPTPGGPTTESIPIPKRNLLPSSKSVLVRANDTIVDPRLLPYDKGVILYEAPIDLRPFIVRSYLAPEIKTVLIDINGIIVHESQYDIGFKIGLWEDWTSRDPRGALGPVVGARVDAGIYTYQRIPSFVNEEGAYALTLAIPPCPGFHFVHTPTYWAQLRYRHFDPEAPEPTGYMEFNFRDRIVCNGQGSIPYGYDPIAVAVRTAVLSIVNNTATIDIRPDIIIDMMMLTGESRLSNLDGNIIPITTTEYEATAFPNPTPVEPNFLDLDRDRYTDFTVLNGDTVDVFLGEQAAELQNATLDENGNPVDAAGNPIDPTLTRFADYEPDFTPQGLLSSISPEDLKETDIYVYRMSTGKIIVKKHGLLDREIIENDGKFYYRMLIPGPLGDFSNSLGFSGTNLAGLVAWQEAIGFPEEMIGRKANALRPGELVKLIAINRPTGYIGTVTAVLQNPNLGTIDFGIDQIVMRPPNLKIQALRSYNIDNGLAANAKAEYQVGFEGAALTSDSIVELHSEWFDHDGTPLPEDLEGYTARLAKVTGTNTLEGGDVTTFSIKPGSYTQLVSFSGDILGTEHFYLHVSGHPEWQDPGIGAGSGPLQYRPRNYVPIKVAIFDEDRTRLLRNLTEYNQQDANAGTNADPTITLPGVEETTVNFGPGSQLVVGEGANTAVYQWVYRPEMQFSVLELELRNQTLTTEYDETTGVTGTTLDAEYTLRGEPFDPLDPFGPPALYVFNLGGAEVEAYVNTAGVASFDNVDALSSASPDDVLTLNLINNNDAGNVLWQYTGVPLIYTNVDKVELVRSHNLGAYNVGNAGTLDDVTDSFRVISFEVPRQTRVKLELTDDDKENVLTTLISEQELPPGSYKFVVSYSYIDENYIEPGEGIDFHLKLTGRVADEDFVHTVYYHGDLGEEFRGRILGEVVEHNVLIQDGSLVLQSPDINLFSYGPALSLTRNYSNKSSASGVMGIGWSHNLNYTLTQAGFGDFSDRNNMPSWVRQHQGRFFRDVPEDEELTKVAVSNGGLFRKEGNLWVGQRGRHGTLTQNATGFVYRSKDGTLYDFTLGAFRTSSVNYIEDLNGNRLTFAYSGSVIEGDSRIPLIDTVTDTIDRTLTFEYANSRFGRRLTHINGPDDIRMEYTYDDTNGQLITSSRVDPNVFENTQAFVQSYGYIADAIDGSWNLNTTTDPNNNTTSYEYYAGAGLPAGLSTYVPGFNAVDVVRTVTYPDTAVIEFFYELGTDNVRRVVDARGNETRFVLNFFGNPLRIEEPAGTVSQMTWSIDQGLPDNVMTSKTDTLNRVWQYQYDSQGNMTRETDPYNNTTITTWDPLSSKILTTTDKNGNVIEREYDINRNLVLLRDAEGFETTSTYDSRGLKTSETNPRGFTTIYNYDSNGFISSVEEPEGVTTEFRHDIRGRPYEQTDGNGNVKQMEYDALDRMVQQIDPDFVVTSFQYDEIGNKIREVTRSSAIYEFQYDSMHRLVSVSRSGEDFDTASKITSYDLNGNVVSDSDWKGQENTYTFDEENRQLSETNRAGDTRLFTYDTVGNRITETDFEGRLYTLVHDDIDRIIETTNPAGDTKTYNYDNENNILSEVDYAGNAMTYTYDRRYKKLTQTNAMGGVYRWNYDENGNMVENFNEIDTRTTVEYDGKDRRVAVNKHLDASTIYTTTFTLDANDNILQTQDPRGNTTSTTYDNMNRKITETDEENFVTTIAYAAAGKRVTTTSPRNVVRVALTDSLDRIIYTRAGDGGITTAEYDANGNMTRTTDARDMVTEVVYDVLDRPTQSTVAVGTSIAQTSQIEYDRVDNSTATVDARNNRTEIVYDNLNRPTEITNAAGDIARTTYDEVGNVLTETDFRQNTTTTVYDDLYRVTSKTDPLTQSVSLSYDAVGNILTETDKRGTITTHQYDALSRLTRSERPDGGGNIVVLVSKEYDGNNNVLAEVDANNNRTEYTYTPRNQVDTTTYADTTTSSMTYDEVGNVLTRTDEAGQTDTVTYDAENRPLTTTNNANEITTMTYDLNGNMLTETKPRGFAWTNTYDLLNRPLTITDPLSQTTSYEYDLNNNLTAQIDAESKRVEYTYDVLNRRDSHIQIKSTGNLTSTFEYDANGNRTALVDAKAQRFVYTFDVLNRLVTRTYPVSTGPFLNIQTITNTYDPNNNLLTVTETKGGTQNIVDNSVYTYDLLDRQLTSTQRGHTVTYGYDDNGNRTSVSTTTGSTTYTFDNRNRLETALVGTELTTYTYFPDSKQETVSYPNNTRMTYSYDAADRLTGVSNEFLGDNSIISQYTYAYDLNSNRSQMIELQNGQTETTTYTYDICDRMTDYNIARVDGVSETTTYTLDQVANRLSEIVTEDTVTVTNKTYVYDDTHWLTTVTDNLTSQNIDYSYDANGNTTQKLDNTQTTAESTLFAYDSRDQLVQMIRGPPAAETTVLGQFDYDYRGVRVRHNNSSRGNINYFYDGTSIIEERNDASQLVAFYRYADRLLSLQTPTDTTYYHQAALGSTTNLTNAAGTAEISYRLDPWGQVREQTGTSANRQIFTGQEHDENTGLIYFGARYYDPDTGRFISQDPNLGNPSTPPSLHRYLYTFANPTRYVDLFGFETTDADYEAAAEMDGANGITIPGMVNKKLMENKSDYTDPLSPQEIEMRDHFYYSGQAPGQLIFDPNNLTESQLGEAQKNFGHLDNPNEAYANWATRVNTTHAYRKASPAMAKFDKAMFNLAMTAAGGGVRTADFMSRYASGRDLAGNEAEVGIGDALSLLGIRVKLRASSGKRGITKEPRKGTAPAHTATAAKARLSTRAKQLAENSRMMSLMKSASRSSIGATAASITRKSNVATEVAKLRAMGKRARAKAKQGCNCCFPGGTQVLTEDGLRSIETLELGDKVASRNEETGEVDWKPITHLFEYDDDRVVYVLILENEAGEQSRIEATHNHPFYVKGLGWIDVVNLKPDMQIPDNENGILTVVSLTKTDRSPITYNLEVADFHTFFVGEQRAWVHNNNCCDDIALGLSMRNGNGISKRSHMSSDGRDLLDRFADKVGAKNYRKWEGGSYLLDQSPKAMVDWVSGHMNKARSIHFNMDNFRTGSYKNFLKRSKGGDLTKVKGRNKWQDHVTSWEFHAIMNNSELLSKTTFYGAGGKVMKMKEVMEVFNKANRGRNGGYGK